METEKIKSKALKKHRMAIRYDDKTAGHLKHLGEKWGEWSLSEIVAKALKECAERKTK